MQENERRTTAAETCCKHLTASGTICLALRRVDSMFRNLSNRVYCAGMYAKHVIVLCWRLFATRQPTAQSEWLNDVGKKCKRTLTKGSPHVRTQNTQTRTRYVKCTAVCGCVWLLLRPLCELMVKMAVLTIPLLAAPSCLCFKYKLRKHI